MHLEGHGTLKAEAHRVAVQHPHAASVSALAQLCIFETLTHRSTLWNGRPRRQIFCPGKQRSLWAVVGSKDSALDPLPVHHRNGKWQWTAATIPQGHQESCSTGGLCSCNLEQPPELPPCWGAPTSDEGFSCRCLLHLNIFCGHPSCPFHTGWTFCLCSPLKSGFVFFP